MTGLNDAECVACDQLIHLALTEDLGLNWGRGDVTTSALISGEQEGSGNFVFRVDGVAAGLPVVRRVLAAVDSRLRITDLFADGERVSMGYSVASVQGPLTSLLKVERTALNFLQRLSGIATLTRCYVDAIKEWPAQILDTRKTLPGWRLLEKYAVRQGGGCNHRLGLHDGILIKDNHLAARRDLSLREVVELARQKQPHLPVEIEVDRLEQLEEVLPSQPDIVLLDNMPAGILRAAVARRNAVAPKVKLEASGGITLTSVHGIAATGVDRISVGALTHSAPALDIALDFTA